MKNEPYKPNLQAYCNTCNHPRHLFFSSKYLSFISTLLIALWPKCSFCFLAYSSALTLCSGKQLLDHSPQWDAGVSLILALLVLVSIALNYKSDRSRLALLLGFSGLLLLAYSQIITGGWITYYSGAGLLFAGAWWNASLPFFLRKLRTTISRATPKENALTPDRRLD